MIAKRHTPKNLIDTVIVPLLMQAGFRWTRTHWYFGEYSLYIDNVTKRALFLDHRNLRIYSPGALYNELIETWCPVHTNEIDWWDGARTRGRILEGHEYATHANNYPVIIHLTEEGT